MKAGVWGLLIAVLATGCERPAWTNPEASRASRTAPEAPERFDDAPAMTAVAVADTPEWSQAVLNRPLHKTFAIGPDCIGNVDDVAPARAGGVGRVLTGWAWDPVGRQAVARILIVHADGRIIGAGDGGRLRKDVPKAIPSIASNTTGWRAATNMQTGPVRVFGQMRDESMCRIAEAKL